MKHTSDAMSGRSPRRLMWLLLSLVVWVGEDPKSDVVWLEGALLSGASEGDEEARDKQNDGNEAATNLEWCARSR
jgi:hypothetical protein